MDIFRAATETATRFNLQSITDAIINEIAPPIDPQKPPEPTPSSLPPSYSLPTSATEGYGVQEVNATEGQETRSGGGGESGEKTSKGDSEWTSVGFDTSVPKMTVDNGDVLVGDVKVDEFGRMEEPNIQEEKYSFGSENDKVYGEKNKRDDDDEVARMKEDIRMYEEAIEKMQVDLDNLRSENEQLHRQIRSQPSIQVSDSSLHDAFVKLAQNWSDDESLDAILSSLPPDLQPLWRPIVASKSSLPPSSSTDAQLATAQKELTRLREHLASIHNEHTIEIADLQSIINEERKEKERIEEIVGVLKEESKALRDELLNERESGRIDGRVIEECERLKEQVEAEKKVRMELEAVLSSYEVAKQSEIEIATGALRKQIVHLGEQLHDQKMKRKTIEEKWAIISMTPEDVINLQKICDEQRQKIALLERRKSLEPTTSPILNIPASGISPEWDVLKSLLIQYLTTPSNHAQRKAEILAVLTSMTNFSDDDRAKIGLIQGPDGKWSRKWNSQTDLTQEHLNAGSLTDMWISFLLNEAKGREIEPK